MGKVIFAADDGVHGRELWVANTDGSGATLLADINPGNAASNPDSFTLLNGRIVFIATTASGGRELWVVGQDEQPIQLIDVADGAANSNPVILTELGGKLFFTAFNAAGGRELHVTDGTVAGTALVKDIRPGATSSSIALVGTVGDQIIFYANDGVSGREMWSSDGTAEGTVLLSDANPGSGGLTLRAEPYTTPTVLYVPSATVGDKLYYIVSTPASGFELWVTDGTAPGTKLVGDIEPGAGSSNPSFVATVGDKLYFSAGTSAGGRELWVLDGTTGTATSLTSIVTFNGGLGEARVVDGKLYFVVNDASTSLWTTDGTVAGTVKLTTNGVSLSGLEIAGINGGVVFRASTVDDGYEVWFSRGQSGDAQLLTSLVAGPTSGFPSELYKFGDFVIFNGGTPTNGSGIWKTDGTAAGTVLLKEVSSQSGARAFVPIGEVDGRVLFKAVFNGGPSSSEQLWSTDGTSSGTVRLATYANNFPRLELPTDYTKVGDHYVFIAGDQIHGRELWTTDGTVVGTHVLVDTLSGARNGEYSNFRVVGDQLYFSARTDADGEEIWQTDGTFAGTHLVRDINPIIDLTAGATVGLDYQAFGGGALFQVEVYEGNTELWFSDGSDGGTVKLLGNTGGIGTGVEVNGKLYFSAQLPGHGWELWVTDGTAEGTHIVQELAAGGASGLGNWAGITAFNGGVLFAAANGQLWFSDGTDGGSARLISASGWATNVMVVGAKAFTEVTSGPEANLWVTDGTADGTVNLGPVFQSLSYPTMPKVIQMGDHWLFIGRGPDGDRELILTDGSIDGTGPLMDFNPSANSNVKNLTFVGGKLFFSANDGGAGEDLWVTDGTEAGTTKVYDEGPAGAGISFPLTFHVEDGFAVTRPIVLDSRLLVFSGSKALVTDGTLAGTVDLGVDLGPINIAQSPLVVGGRAFFIIRTVSGDRFDLWSTDGSAAGTTRVVQDGRQLSLSVSTDNQTATLDGKIVFIGGVGDEFGIWTTDGTLAGTQQLTNFMPVDSQSIVSLGGRLVFSANTAGEGAELWLADASGVTMFDLRPGVAGSDPNSFVLLNGLAYFVATVDGGRNELWKSDGTAGGTERVIDLTIGTIVGAFGIMLVADHLTFLADDGVNGYELWVSDGTAAGTVRVTETVAPSDGSPGPVVQLPAPPPPPPPYDEVHSGNNLGNAISGGATRDFISGLGGPDKLNGLGGDDILDGGDGNDLLFGGAGADTLDGGAGNDRLDGGDGVDLLRGGAGNDVYIVGAGDVIVELAGEGADSVEASVSFALPDNVENLKLVSATAFDGFGNDLANKIVGNNLSNRLEGGGGNDTLEGFNGDDIILGGSGGDIIQGGGGDDVVIGGAGNDTMRGGSGADVFVVLQESIGINETDTIKDFYISQGDAIDLSAIDANALVDGDQAFTLVSSFTKSAGQMTLTWIANQGTTLLRLDVDGDGRIDYQMKINGNVTGDSDGWIL
jgi:ELWxxDGT repeat protein